MKRILITSLFVVLFVIFILYSCSFQPAPSHDTEQETANMIVIPDITNTDEITAKLVLTHNGLIPIIKYKYNDYVEEGKVTMTEPRIHSLVEPNSKVTVYISLGSYTYD